MQVFIYKKHSIFMLSQNFTYIFLDLETTWLDSSKDEPIQIGIIQIDHNLDILDTYTSLIKPQKSLQDLKHIVQYVTGFQLDDLEQARSIQDILPEIKRFLTPNNDKPIIMIGHNIWFDYAILSRYMDLHHIKLIDTYPLSKGLMHFQTSYALDVLHKTALQHWKIQDRQIEKHELKRGYHDALGDCLANLELWWHMISHIQKLRKKHLMIDYVFEKGEQGRLLSSIIQRSTKHYNLKEKRLFLPNLKKQNYSWSDKKIIKQHAISFDEIPEKSSLYVWNTSLDQILENIARQEKPYILSFSHKSKWDIAAQYFKKNGIHTNTLHDQVIMNPDRIDIFLKKWDFSDSEILFVIKWFSQSDLWHNLLDINSGEDYMYFNALHSKKKSPKWSVIITTHEHLLSMSHNIKETSHVLLFDQDRRYVAIDKMHKQVFDPLHLLNALDQLVYKRWLLDPQNPLYKDIQKFAQSCEMLIAIYSIEINHLFIWHDKKSIEREPLEQSNRFPRTKIMFDRVKNYLHLMEKKLWDEDKQSIIKTKNMLRYLEHGCQVQKRMYMWDKRYYTMMDFQTYLTREDFESALAPAKYIYMTNNSEKQQYTYDTNLLPVRKKDDIHIWYQWKISWLLRQLDKHLLKEPHYIFIISASKSKSQELFKYMIDHKRQNKLDIYAENITGGIGKNVSHAVASAKHVVIIWWLNMFLASRAGGISFPMAYVYFAHGKKTEQMMRDIKRYA